MNDFIDEVMGFNPQDMSVFNEQPTTNYDQNVYKTNPKDSKAEDGHYRSKIRVIYNPFDIKRSIVQQANYAMRDTNGFFMVRSKLANGDKTCPIFTSWKKLWFSNDENKKAWAKKMYEKSESQWVLVQILEDVNKPELVGQIKVMKLPKAIYNKLVVKTNPSPESKKTPVPVMDYLIGLPLEMDVIPGPDDPNAPERKQREISYDLCDFDTDYAPITKIDGTQLFTDEELETIESYVSARTDFAKAKTDAKKKAAQDAINQLHDGMRELYKKAMDYLKENSIDLVEECGYHEWGDELTSRVQNWIDVVAQLQDPSTISSAPTTTTTTNTTPNVTTNTETTQAPSDPFSEVADNDLPF